MSDKFITVLTFTYPHEAAIIRSHLEAEGIECFIKDELTTQVQPFLANLTGGVQLQIREKDLPAAREILKESGYIQ